VGRSEAEREQVRAEVAKAVREAKQAAKGRGKVPGGWAVWASEWEAGRRAAQAEARRWERQLRAYLGRELSRRRGEESPSYARPRWAPSLASGRLVPGGLRTQAQVALVLDTSGSMRGAGAEVARVVEAICRATVGGAEGVRVVAVDTEVHADSRVTSAREVAQRGLLRGGGGTDLRAGLARACEPQRGWRADVVVVVTDGDGEWPKTAPRVPVLVALVGERRRQYLPAWVRAVVEVE
jgi:predicted metal-dependent peptidase